MQTLELLETLRNRAMYGDNYNPDGPNLWQPSHWAAMGILAGAMNHLTYGHLGQSMLRGQSTVAVFQAQREYFAWCDSPNTDGGIGITNGDMIEGGHSINELGGSRPEWSPEFWQEESPTLHQALAERGFHSRAGTIDGKREVYNNLTGEIAGEFTAAQSWEWIGQQAQNPENRARQHASADGLRCIESEAEHEVWSDGVLTITGIETLVLVYGTEVVSNA